jgi:hypothetical protein
MDAAQEKLADVEALTQQVSVPLDAHAQCSRSYS